MSLCESCCSITFNKLIVRLQRDGWDHEDTTFVHLKRGCDLLESARECPLCAMIAEVLLSASPSQGSSSSAVDTRQVLPRHLKARQLTEEPLHFNAQVDPLGYAFPLSADRGFELRGFNVFGQFQQRDGLFGGVSGAIRLFTKDDAPILNEMIIGRQLLQDSGSEDAFKLVKRWLKACREDQRDHAKCRTTLSGWTVTETAPPHLPLRVIDVGDNEGMDSLRLIESKGMMSRYIALSHCWGLPERPPLRTTASNLQAHLQQINWSDLPKTFKDAITTVRKIGHRYLWIDSLCIVQDDQEEWLRESVKMGWIYERADLTLAASHSPDSWHGLFLPRSASPNVELPHFLEDQQTSTRVFATIRREERYDTFPELGPLSKRAWATQEWLLSRRIVFYTNGQMIWSCKSHTQRETGEKFYCTARDIKWKNIIEQYSDRQLTHLTDRLIALEGLQTEFQKRNPDVYLHGLWKNSLPDQLLWQVNTKVYQACNPLNLPSWTWASIPCGVRFLHIAGAKNLCASIKGDGDKGLIIKAMVKQVEVLRRAVKGVNDWKKLEEEGENGERAKEVERHQSRMARDIENSNAKQTASLHWCIDNTNGDSLGWVVFDVWTENPASKSLFCLALMGSLPRREEETERRTGISISMKPREYWIIALEPCDGGSYKRVGVGKVYIKGWWRDAIVQEVRIL